MPRVLPAVTPGEKRCTGCQDLLPLTDFTQRTRAPDGRSLRCRICQQHTHRIFLSRHTDGPSNPRTKTKRALTRRGGVIGYDYLWREVWLPHDVVAAQLTRYLHSGRPMPTKRQEVVEDWLHLRNMAAVARMTGRNHLTVKRQLSAALTVMWDRDQRTHPGETWCDEQGGL